MTNAPAQKPPKTEEFSESTTHEDHTACDARIAELEDQLQTAKETALRAQADYQNLLRRTREDQSNMVKLAAKSLVQDLLEPLQHLSMTAEQMNDKVLTMVVSQLMQSLKMNGVEELEVMGKPFDLKTMEVVDLVDGATEKDGVVVKIVKRGYTLNGIVLQHAKVVIGKAAQR